MKTYSAEFKSGIIAKMMPPNNVGVAQISQETGIPKDTLYAWRLKARGYRERDLPNGAAAKRVLGSEDKFNIVLETAGMNAEELSAYCRRKGLYPDQIADWARQCTTANDPQNNKINREKLRQQEREIKQLKAELRRKEKALAEAAALLVLKKKAQEIWGDPEDD
jgi:transposase-like protein